MTLKVPQQAFHTAQWRRFIEDNCGPVVLGEFTGIIQPWRGKSAVKVTKRCDWSMIVPCWGVGVAVGGDGWDSEEPVAGLVRVSSDDLSYHLTATTCVGCNDISLISSSDFTGDGIIHFCCLTKHITSDFPWISLMPGSIHEDRWNQLQEGE